LRGPARGAPRAAGRPGGAGPRRRPPPARERDRAHAAARHLGHRDRPPGRGGGRGDPRGDRLGMRGLFVTGTDTGVEKTFVAGALAHALRRRGARVAVAKPVETGVEGEPEDACRLRAAAADPAPLIDVCPYRLRAPLAPAVAARQEGLTIDGDRIVAPLHPRAAQADVLLV